MGFLNSLIDVVKRERPDHLAVCFDKGGSEARNEMFPDYKIHIELVFDPPWSHEKISEEGKQFLNN